jgi:hypothetical protein
MQAYARDDAPRAIPVLTALCGRFPPGWAMQPRLHPAGTAPPDRPSCGLQMARGHRRHGKPPAGLRRAQRNHASGLRPWLSFPCYRLPSRPAIASPLRPSWHTPPSGACGSPLATVCPPGPPAPLRAPAANPVRGPASYITRNYPQPVGCPAPARIIFVMQNAGPALRAPARPGCRAAPARTALLVAGSPACHPVRPRRWLPKSRRWRDGDL